MAAAVTPGHLVLDVPEMAPREVLADVGVRQLGAVAEAVTSPEENVHVLRDFRKNCDILISVGECAIMGGIRGRRNDVSFCEIIV